MAHKTQWSYDDYRNAERAAKIQAQAIIKAQRAEQERQERLARKRTPPRTPIKVETPQHYVNPEGQQFRRELYAKMDRLQDKIAKSHADIAMSHEFGSQMYIYARYGPKAWDAKVAEYREKFGYSEQEAIDYILATYTEESWKSLEQPLVEKYIVHHD